MPKLSDKKSIFHRLFLISEKILYICIGLGLMIGTGEIIFEGFKALFHTFSYKTFSEGAINVLDKFLIAMMFLEILYTLQIIVEEEYESKCLEPFLLVGIIALVRRLLIIGFEASHSEIFNPLKFKYYLLEILTLGFLIILLTFGVIFLRKNKREKGNG